MRARLKSLVSLLPASFLEEPTNHASVITIFLFKIVLKKMHITVEVDFFPPFFEKAFDLYLEKSTREILQKPKYCTSMINPQRLPWT